jgi:hypothetical protein
MQIYGAVFMNNILGFVVISILIYMRNITWEFSADVLVVAIVCIVMGLTASFRATFPLWTSLPAYLLYLIHWFWFMFLKMFSIMFSVLLIVARLNEITNSWFGLLENIM